MQSTVDVAGMRVACCIEGSGPPLLLLHGAEGSHRMFDLITPYLSPRFTVIRYDQRDCGGTDNPARDSSLAELAGDAAALLQALGYARVHVYGTSFGGRVAQMLAIREPALVDRLVLGSTWPLARALEELNPTGVRQIHALRERLPASAAALAAYFFPAPFLAEHPHFNDLFSNVQPGSARSQRRAAVVGDCPALDLAQVRAPTLLIAGSDDLVVPPAITTGMAAALRGSESVVLDGVGHAGVAQVPQLIAGHICRFLQAHPVDPEASQCH